MSENQSRNKTEIYSFEELLQTTRVQQTTTPRGYEVAQNGRNSQGPFAPRDGMKRLAIATAGVDAKIVDFDGTNDYLTVGYDSRVHAFQNIPAWTIAGLVQCDSLAAAHHIFARDTVGATLRDIAVYMDSTTGGRIVAEFRDSSANLTTLQVTGLAASTIVAWAITCVAGAVTLYANASSATGTLTTGTIATNSDNIFIGAKNGPAEYFDGRIEYIRGFNVAVTSLADGWNRLINPRAQNVIFDYVCEIDSTTGFCLDRSKYENHADVNGTPATTATLLGNPPVPIQAMYPLLNKNNLKRLAVVARGDVYTAIY